MRRFLRDQFQVMTGYVGDSSQPTYAPYWFLEPGPMRGEVRTVTLALPTVYETTTTQQAGNVE